MVENGFPKSDRLLKRREFLRLSDRGDKIHSRNFIVICDGKKALHARIGITVSRKVGNAVNRNRIKRLVREFYRQNKDLFKLKEYNIIAKTGAVRLQYVDIVRELTSLLQRLG